MSVVIPDPATTDWVPVWPLNVPPVSPGLIKLWDSIEAGVVLPAAAITTPVLPTGYKRWIVEYALATTGAVIADTLVFRCNGDTSASYVWQDLYAKGTTVAGTDSGGAATSATIGYAAGPAVRANMLGIGRLKIEAPDAATSHPFRCEYAVQWGAASLQGIVGASEGMFAVIAPLTTLTFLPLANSLANTLGARVTVYGES